MAAKITAVPDPVASSVLVTVTGATGATITISRVDSSGGTTPIRNGDPGTLLGGGWIDHDYECPLDEKVHYTAGSQATSGTITLDSLDNTWLKHPGRPDLNMVVNVVDIGDRTYTIAQGSFNALGRKYPVVVSSLRYGPTHSAVIRTDTQDECNNLRAILDEPSILLLSTPDGYDVGSIYVAVGDVIEARAVPVGWETARQFTLPLTQVERPVGLANAGAGNTWNDVLAAYPTWNAVIAARATWNDLIRQVTG